jgi:hypothetical protein
LITENGDIRLEKSVFHNDMGKTFRLIYPEKTDAEVDTMIDRSYEKFEDVIQDI